MANQDPNTQTTGFNDLDPVDQILSIQNRDEEAATLEAGGANEDPTDQGTPETQEQAAEETPEQEPEQFEDGDEGDDDVEREFYELEDDYMVKLGEDEFASFKDLREGNLRQADYTRKTQELAQQKKEFEETYGSVDQYNSELQQVTQLRASLANELEVFQGDAQSKLEELSKLDWDTLRDEDPEEYTLKKLERADLKEKIDLAQKDKQKLVSDQIDQNRSMFEQAVKQTNKLLSGDDGIPGWSDAEKGKVIRQEMKDFALNMGFSEDELNMTVDPRLLKVLHLAAQAQKSPPASSKSLEGKKARQVPRVSKPRPSGRKPQKQSSLVDRLRTEQSQKSAEDLLFDAIQNGKL